MPITITTIRHIQTQILRVIKTLRSQNSPSPITKALHLIRRDQLSGRRHLTDQQTASASLHRAQPTLTSQPSAAPQSSPDPTHSQISTGRQLSQLPLGCRRTLVHSNIPALNPVIGGPASPGTASSSSPDAHRHVYNIYIYITRGRTDICIRIASLAALRPPRKINQRALYRSHFTVIIIIIITVQHTYTCQPAQARRTILAVASGGVKVSLVSLLFFPVTISRRTSVYTCREGGGGWRWTSSMRPGTLRRHCTRGDDDNNNTGRDTDGEGSSGSREYGTAAAQRASARDGSRACTGCS